MNTQPETVEKCAFERAADLYERHQLQPDLASELTDHLHTGLVIARPELFVLGKAVLLADGRPAAFITVAVGDLGLLLEYLPRSLPWIAFRRRGESEIRVYATERFCRLSAFGLKPGTTQC